jgi:hypothetical protein
MGIAGKGALASRDSNAGSKGTTMRSSFRLLLASAAIAISPTVVMAADMPVYKAPIAAPAKVEYGNIYFGFDTNSHHGLAGYAGILYAPTGMHQSGVRISVFGLGGVYEYHGGVGEEFKGRFVSTDALIGWSHVFNNGAVTLSIGANYQNHRVRPFDANNSVQGGELGFKVQADIWLNPTERTLLYALGSYSTAFNTYYAIGRAGYDFFGNQVFFGPEVGGLGNDRTDQVRVGAHVTGFRFAGGRVTLSGGWLHERGEGDGAYAAGSIDFSF